MKLWGILMMMGMMILTSCTDPKTTLPPIRYMIQSREIEKGGDRPLIYQNSAPANWRLIPPDPLSDWRDTRQPIQEFEIEEEAGLIRVTIHTFPFHDPRVRIPPQAQTQRWKDQFENLDLYSVIQSEEHWNGFSGLKIEASGEMKGEKTAMMAWSMQLASLYIQGLLVGSTPSDIYKLADVTIKVIGAPDALDKQRNQLETFAKSFEFIEELPIRL